MDGPSRRPTDSSLRSGTPSLSEVPSGGARALWLLWGFSKVTRRKGGTPLSHPPITDIHSAPQKTQPPALQRPLHMRRPPNRIRLDINNLKPLPKPKINRPSKKRMSMQVNHLRPLPPRLRLQRAVQLTRQPESARRRRHKQAYHLNRLEALVIQLGEAPVVGHIADGRNNPAIDAGDQKLAVAMNIHRFKSRQIIRHAGCAELGEKLAASLKDKVQHCWNVVAGHVLNDRSLVHTTLI